jgi:hypothetical protein
MITEQQPDYVRMTITVPVEVKTRMDVTHGVNWSSIASQAFEQRLLKLSGAKMVTMERENFEQMIDLALAFVKGSRELLAKYEANSPQLMPVSALNDRHHVGATPTKQLQLDYWLALRTAIAIKQRTSLKPREPQARHYLHVRRLAARGTSFILAAVVNTPDSYIDVEWFIQGPNAKESFNQLEAQKVEIEQELGARLDWMKLPLRKSCRIVLIRPNSNIKDRAQWAEQHDWLIASLERFESVFRPRIQSL